MPQGNAQADNAQKQYSHKAADKAADKQVKENKRSAENAERWKKSHDTYMDISSHESTVILLHEGDHRAKMTVPIVVTRSFYKEAHKKNEASSFAAESSVVAGLVSSSESFVDDGAYKSAKQKGAFNYQIGRASCRERVCLYV